MKNFKDYYKFPLESDSLGIYVLTADGQHAFNWLCRENEILRQDVVDKINGDEHLEGVPRTWSVQQSSIGRVICCDDAPVLLPQGETLARYFNGIDLFSTVFCVLIPVINTFILIFFSVLKLFEKLWEKIKYWEK